MRSLAERLRAFEQQKARLADTEAKLKIAEKKARNRRLIELGTLVEKAELPHLSTEALYGALLSLSSAAKNNRQVEQWTSIGVQSLQQEDNENLEPVVLTFSYPLEKETSAILRAAGLRFNKLLRHWEGILKFEDAEELATAYEGIVRKIFP